MTFKATERLFGLKDEKYADFQSKLTPGVPRECFIGVRNPDVRKLAKEYLKDPESELFMKELPHKYYDENMLHGMMISEIKDYGKCLEALDMFLPYVDNWAVCDSMSPKIFKKHRSELIDQIKVWISSERSYTCRFGIGTLMGHYLDEDFNAEYLELPASVKSDEYYVKMMVAWFFATALAKQWDASVPYIEQGRLDKWVHNKTIQKARESFRVSPEHKEYLSSLKIK